jgi:hypothetical protein
MKENVVEMELRIVEANHADDAFWTLAGRVFNSLEEMDAEFRAIPSEPRKEDSDRDYIIDKMVGADAVDEKFVSAETVERLTGRKIGRMRAGAKNSLRAEIARWDSRNP